MVIAGFYQTLVPKYQAAYQGASWQEALHGAEAGADYGLQCFNEFVVTTKDPEAYDWAGNEWSFSDSSYTNNGERALADSSLPVLGGPGNVAVTRLAVDVYTRVNTAPYSPWYRIRSTARADLPGRYASADKRDAELRRMKLGDRTGGVSTPHVTRTVELIVRPKFRFSRAIVTALDMSLGNSSNWIVESFDSADTAHSDPGTIAGGIYPGAGTASERLSNGSIATLKPEPAGVTYGSLISGNGAIVAGDVSTAGGDDPGTAAHENVSGSGGMNQNRIYDDFDEDLSPVSKPVWSSVSPNPPGNTNFVTGASAATPSRYVINGNLGSFAVTAPAAGATGYVEILVNGNVNIGNGNNAKIVIPPNVYASIYVDGNIDFGNGTVNADDASSKVATHLTVYGVHSTGTYVASGNNVEILAFYGPNYGVTLNGTVTTVGAMAAKSFSISGGGNGGFHYDEALGRRGDIVGWGWPVTSTTHAPIFNQCEPTSGAGDNLPDPFLQSLCGVEIGIGPANFAAAKEDAVGVKIPDAQREGALQLAVDAHVLEMHLRSGKNLLGVLPRQNRFRLCGFVGRGLAAKAVKLQSHIDRPVRHFTKQIGTVVRRPGRLWLPEMNMRSRRIGPRAARGARHTSRYRTAAFAQQMPMFPSFRTQRIFRRILHTSIAILAGASSAKPAALTWSGLGLDGNISTAGNWSPVQAPVGGDSLTFAGTTRLTPQATSNLAVASISFSNTAGLFTLGGSGVYTINTGGITNSSVNAETINNALVLAGAQSWNANSGLLVFNGMINNGGFLLTISGAKRYQLDRRARRFRRFDQNRSRNADAQRRQYLYGSHNASAGKVAIGSDTAFGTGSLVLDGATIQSSGGNHSVANSISVTASTTFSPANDLTFNGNASLTGNRTFSVNGAGVVTFNGIMSDASGSRRLTKTGTGTLVLNGANTYKGGLTFSAGTLVLGNNAAAGTGTLSLGTGTLQGGGGARTLGNAVTLAGNTIFSGAN